MNRISRDPPTNFVKMRGFILFTAFLFLVQLSFAQLSISPSPSGKDHYLYIKGNLLFVSNGIHLQKNNASGAESNIYLREGGQLIQDSSQTTSNSGTGSLSIFQEGTSNAFDYNYWASPVSTSQNALFGISMLHAPVSEIYSQPAKITSALNGTANPLTISNQWIYTFSGNAYSNWTSVGGSTSIPAGYGFTMKGTQGKDPVFLEGRENNPGNSQRYDFRGKPNSGTLEIPVISEGFVLVGNPYPSSLDLSLFLLENSGVGNLKPSCYGNIERRNAITGIAYFWDSKEDGNSHYLQDYLGGYGSFSPIDPCTTGVYEKPLFKTGGTGKMDGSAGNHYERRFVPVAQGFMVQGAESSVLQFKNSQRIFRKEGNNSHFKKAETNTKSATPSKGLIEVPKMQFLININDEYVRSLTLAFWPTATTKTDVGMDALAFDLAPADVGWLQEDRNYVIEVRPFELTDEIPLFLKTDGKIASFRFSPVGGNFEPENIFILDTQTNTYYSIKEEAFEISLEPGTYHGRFKIAFMEKSALAELPEELLPVEDVLVEFSIFHNNYSAEIEIIGNSYSPVKSVGIYDLQGKKIYFRSNFGNRRSISISTEGWANALYIVNVVNMNNEKTSRKISVLKYR